MRPPQNAGGFRSKMLPTETSSSCFNEAPAKRGGIRRLRRHLREVVSRTSMRTVFTLAQIQPKGQRLGGVLMFRGCRNLLIY